MNTARAFVELAASGMDLAADAAALSAAERSTSVGQALTALHEVYFGATTNSAKQRRARANAQDQGLSFVDLQLIESFAAPVKDVNKAWDLRAELCGTAPDRIAQAAQAFLRKLRRANKREPRDGVRIYRRKGKASTLTVTGNAHVLDSIYRSLDEADPVASLKEGFFSGGATMPELKTNVVLTLDQMDRISDGEGDDITVHLTNGATMTGAEFVTQTLAEHGYITVAHPVEGPVNLYRVERFASAKQRIMLEAVSTTCIWPNCNVPIQDCQFHHIKSFESGGHTNISNLVPVCAHHNGANEDHAERPVRRGKIIRKRGTIAWMPPWNGPPLPIETFYDSG